jgi:hypothetical protein
LQFFAAFLVEVMDFSIPTVRKSAGRKAAHLKPRKTRFSSPRSGRKADSGSSQSRSRSLQRDVAKSQVPLKGRSRSSRSSEKSESCGSVPPRGRSSGGRPVWKALRRAVRSLARSLTACCQGGSQCLATDAEFSNTQPAEHPVQPAWANSRLESVGGFGCLI